MSCPNCGALLPEPRERFCPACGADLDAAGAGFEAPPAEPSPPTTPRPRMGTPWDDRARIGLVPALVETTQKVLTAPASFFAAMPVTGGIGGPLLYAIVLGTLGAVLSALYSAVFRSFMGTSLSSLGGGSELRRLMPFVMGGAGVVLQVIVAPLLVILALFVGAAIAHLMLLLLGGARNGFEATFRVLCYAEAANVIRIIPACGELVFAAYCLVLTVIGLAAAHRIGIGKAAAAVLIPMAILCCCCAGGILVAVGGLASALGQMK